jgi:hypothetical protein
MNNRRGRDPRRKPITEELGPNEIRQAVSMATRLIRQRTVGRAEAVSSAARYYGVSTRIIYKHLDGIRK